MLTLRMEVLFRNKAYWGSAVSFTVRDQMGRVYDVGPFEGHTFHGIQVGHDIWVRACPDGSFERILWVIPGGKSNLSLV